MTDEQSAVLAMLDKTPLILSSRCEKEAPLIEAAKQLRRDGLIDMAEDTRRNLFAMRLTPAARAALQSKGDANG